VVDKISDDAVHILAAYGLFMVNWSLFEITLEVGIMKQVELHPVEGTIVTSGLQIERRASILRSLLAIHGEKKFKETIMLINQVVAQAKRNSIIHGHVFFGGDGKEIKFVQRNTDQKLTAKSVSFDAKAMLAHAASLREKIVSLQELLSISNSDLEEFAKVGLILTNKSETSHKQPNSKT
jgi:hypothetical protein